MSRVQCGNLILNSLLKSKYECISLHFVILLLTYDKIVYRMPAVVRNREYSPAEKMFVVDLKLKGIKYTTIKSMFLSKFNKAPPH